MMYIEGAVLLIFPQGKGPLFQKWKRCTFSDFTACFSASRSEIHMVEDGSGHCDTPRPLRPAIPLKR